MKPLARLILFAVILAVPPAFFSPVRAQESSNPIDALTQKLKSDPNAREAAAKSLETFVLTPDSNGKSFVMKSVDSNALAAVVREWTVQADAGSLAVLSFVSTPGSKSEGRLRRALSDWTGRAQIAQRGEKDSVVAFLNVATENALRILNDPRTLQEVDVAIEANDQSVPLVPSARASVERARQLNSRPGPGTDVFGPERNPGAINPDSGPTGPGQVQGARAASGDAALIAQRESRLPAANLPANFKNKSIDVPSPMAGGDTGVRAEESKNSVSALAQKLKSDPNARKAAAKSIETFVLTPDSNGKSFVKSGNSIALAATVHAWAVKTDANSLAVLSFVSTPGSKLEGRLRMALSDWTGRAQIAQSGEKDSVVAFLNDATEKARRVLQDRRTRQEVDAAIEANDQSVPVVPAGSRSTSLMRKP